MGEEGGWCHLHGEETGRGTSTTIPSDRSGQGLHPESGTKTPERGSILNFRATWEEYGPPIDAYAPMNPSAPNILPGQWRDARLRLEPSESQREIRTPVIPLGHPPDPRRDAFWGPKPPESSNPPHLPTGTLVPHAQPREPADIFVRTPPTREPPGFGSAKTPNEGETNRITETRREIERKYFLEKGLEKAREFVEEETEKIIKDPLTLKEMTRGRIPNAREDRRRMAARRRRSTSSSARRGTRRSSPAKTRQIRLRARPGKGGRGSSRSRKTGARSRGRKAPRAERKRRERLARKRARSSLRRLERLLRFAKRIAHAKDIVSTVTGTYTGIRQLFAGDFSGAFTEFRSTVVPIDIVVDLANYAGFESLTGRTLDEYIGEGHAGEDLYYLSQNSSFREIVRGAWITYFGD